MHEEVIQQARKFWTKVAEDNGWSMDGRKVIVWLNEAGQMEDAIYAPVGEKHDIVVNGETVYKY